MKSLSKLEILSKQDLPREEIDVPEWGGSVYIRALTARERVAYEKAVIERNGKDVQTNTEKAISLLVVMCLVDEEGNRLFTDDEVDSISDKNATVIARLYLVAMRMSKLFPNDVQVSRKPKKLSDGRRFQYTLALKLGWSNVDAMLDSMTSSQYAEWLAFYSINPFGEERDDYRTASLSASMFNSHGGKKNKTAYGIEDFLLKFDGHIAKKSETPEDIKKKFLELIPKGGVIDKRNK